MDSKTFYDLQEAYLDVYANVDEGVYDPNKSKLRPASERSARSITPARRAQLERERKKREDLEHAGNLALAGMRSSGTTGRVQTTPTPKPAAPEANRVVRGRRDTLASRADKILRDLQGGSANESYDVYEETPSQAFDRRLRQENPRFANARPGDLRKHSFEKYMKGLKSKFRDQKDMATDAQKFLTAHPRRRPSSKANESYYSDDYENIMELGGASSDSLERFERSSAAYDAKVAPYLEKMKAGQLPWQQQKKADEAQKFLRKHPRRRPSSKANESYDVYDEVLDYLLDEGYADSVESAEVIMVNMSEDWKDSILDERWGGRGYSEPIGGADRNLSPRYRGLGGGTLEDEAYEKRRQKSAAAAANSVKQRLYANLAREAARRNR